MFQVSHLQSGMLILSILNHHCYVMVHYYLFGVFHLSKLQFFGFLQHSQNNSQMPAFNAWLWLACKVHFTSYAGLYSELYVIQMKRQLTSACMYNIITASHGYITNKSWSAWIWHKMNQQVLWDRVVFIY